MFSESLLDKTTNSHRQFQAELPVNTEQTLRGFVRNWRASISLQRERERERARKLAETLFPGAFVVFRETAGIMREGLIIVST